VQLPVNACPKTKHHFAGAPMAREVRIHQALDLGYQHVNMEMA